MGLQQDDKLAFSDNSREAKDKEHKKTKKAPMIRSPELLHYTRRSYYFFNSPAIAAPISAGLSTT